MKILFCNSIEPNCGVHQYGVHLFSALNAGSKHEMLYDRPTSIPDVRNWIEKEGVEALVINWHPNLEGWVRELERHNDPFRSKIPKVLAHHDWISNESLWDAIIFSDPTMINHGKWFSIPRPLPAWTPVESPVETKHPKIGVHGFNGASANMVVERGMKEFESATFRLHLPFATFGDPDGKTAKEMAGLCRDLVKGNERFKLDVNHEFLTMHGLLAWLSENDLNCYFRDIEPDWMGVSSALDAALAVRRPMAINKCKGFRHLHDLSQSICIEDRTLLQIIESGCVPLAPVHERNSVEKMGEAFDSVMKTLVR